MRRPLSLIPALLLLAVAASAATPPADVPRALNTESAEGIVRLEPRELWRAGGLDDEEDFFGVVFRARASGDLVYLLDTQLATIHVYRADGTFVGTLGREGEGPGEFRFPTNLLVLPEGRIGVTVGMGGKIVVLEPDGTPDESIIPGDPTTGGFVNFFDAKCRGDRLLLCLARMSFGDEGVKEHRELAFYDEKGDEGTVFWQHDGVRDMEKPKFVERDEYNPANRFDVDAEGRVYMADRRDDYVISVYGPDGTLERTIERPDYAPRVRTQEEKDEFASGMVMRGPRGRIEIENVVEDTEPAVNGLFIDDDGLLWVSDSHFDRHDGVYRRYDVFDRDGAWLRSVDLILPGDSERDGLIPLGDGRFLLISGLQDASEAMRAGFREADAEEDEDVGDADPLEIICYDIRGL